MSEVNASGAGKVHQARGLAQLRRRWLPSLQEFAVFDQFDAGTARRRPPRPRSKPISLTPRRPADLIRALRSSPDRTQPSQGWLVFPDGQVAQLVEQRTENPRVDGSIPSLATIPSSTDVHNRPQSPPESVAYCLPSCAAVRSNPSSSTPFAGSLSGSLPRLRVTPRRVTFERDLGHVFQRFIDPQCPPGAGAEAAFRWGAGSYLERDYLPEAKALTLRELDDRGVPKNRKNLIRQVRDEIEIRAHASQRLSNHNVERFQTLKFRIAAGLLIAALWITALVAPTTVEEWSSFPTALACCC
jgi:hypothetical protein